MKVPFLLALFLFSDEWLQVSFATDCDVDPSPGAASASPINWILVLWMQQLSSIQSPLLYTRRVHRRTFKSSRHSHSWYCDPPFPFVLMLSFPTTRYLWNCSVIFSTTPFFVAFPPNMCLLSAYIVTWYICIFPSLQSFQRPCIAVVDYTC